MDENEQDMEPIPDNDEIETALDSPFERLILSDDLRDAEDELTWLPTVEKVQEGLAQLPRKQFSHSTQDVHGGWSELSRYRHAAEIGARSLRRALPR